MKKKLVLFLAAGLLVLLTAGGYGAFTISKWIAADRQQAAVETGKVAGEEQQGITVVTTINNGTSATSYKRTISTPQTAIQLLGDITKENRIELTTKEYSFGVLVEGIGDIANDPQEGYYWIYYVNDKSADVGASDYLVQDGDTIRWQYEKSQG